MNRLAASLCLIALLAPSSEATAQEKSKFKLPGINIPGVTSPPRKKPSPNRGDNQKGKKPGVQIPPISLPGIEIPGIRLPEIGPPVVEPPVLPPITQPKPPVFCPTPPPAVHPPQPIPSPVQQGQWYFGMSLERANTQYGMGLKVSSVVPQAPAWLADLEAGDVLFAANGQSLQQAQSNQHGVQLIQAAVILQPANEAPAPTVTTAVMPSVSSTQPVAQLTVLDARSRALQYVTVTPTRIGPPAPMPMPAPTPTLPTPVPQPAPTLPTPAPTATF